MATVSETTTTVELTPLPALNNPRSNPAAATAAAETARLGSTRQRIFDVAPSNILSKATRSLITTLIILANVVQFVSNFVTIAAGTTFTRDFGRKSGPGQANWMPASYSLTQGAFVLISGRLGAVYGHQRILLLGGAIIVVFSIANAFCASYESFVAVRALTGVGGGLVMPNAVAMITIMLPPGRSRNLTMGFFASAAPIGGWLGALFAGVFATSRAEWKWLFIFIAALGTFVFGGLAFLLPHEQPIDKEGKIDYTGACLGVGSLLLFNFCWNQAPSVGWKTPYEIACLVLSLALFASFLLWEKFVATEPVMPLDIFRTPTFTALVFVVLLSYMSFGISLWYMISWQQELRGWSVMQTAVGWIPFAMGAVVAVGLAAWLIPRMAAQWIMAIGIGVMVVSNLLLATMPVQQTYWAQTFPAVLVGSICPDFVYVAAQIIASNSVSRKQQGVAGSLIGTLNLYGNSLGLGFAGTIETELTKGQVDPIKGYRAALYFGAALAVAGLLIDFAFVRMPKDEREGWGADTEGETYHDELGVTGHATGVQRETPVGSLA
ncbi:major facilitator superfamily-domain-containing protein [Apiospora kogelbergensis]|uniref:Major facilitator superfamily-domain-containing protein n=1 Tax=Apiospora kogelbergensis TaxID=1337665 RepID=A0AAW0QN62_9PEZI